MKILQTVRTEKFQHIFEASLVVVLLLILPMLGPHMGKHGGGAAMAIGSVIGLIAYFLLYGERLRNRGQMKSVMLVVSLSVILGAGAAVAVWLIRGH
jgi:O-antigen/teichoic acid export membrane protein